MSHSNANTSSRPDVEEEDYQLEDVITALEYFGGSYPREEVDYAVAHKHMITPKLLAILEAVRENPERYLKEEDYFGHIYALMLLGHFRETAAHAIILDLFRLPAKTVDEMFGDIITEELPSILFRTCGGSFDGIKALAMDEDANEYCRGAAMRAISLAACHGLLPREGVLEFLRAFLEEAVAEVNGFVTSLAVSNICDLGPEESMDKIVAAFDRGEIDEIYIDVPWVEDCVAKGAAACMKRTVEQSASRSLDNVHASMSWWACFNESPERRSVAPPGRSKPKKNVKSKAKRKQSSSSRKKNRR